MQAAAQSAIPMPRNTSTSARSGAQVSFSTPNHAPETRSQPQYRESV
ncbi:hypothetical protein [Morganella morganii]|nr:hypothetical protein [Morganella morganii]